MRLVLTTLVVLLTAGCVVTPPVGPPAVSPPDLRGTWIGTWGGTPLSFVVIDQQISTGDSGVVIGSWQLLGQYYPTVNGVMTTTIGGEAISTNMTGQIAQWGQGFALVLRGRSSRRIAWSVRASRSTPGGLKGPSKPSGIAERRVSAPADFSLFITGRHSKLATR